MKKANDRGQDRAIKTKYALLARIFHSEALPEAQKSLVDDEVEKGRIDLYKDDDPVKTVLAMVNIVAVDSPIAKVTRLISTYQKVVSCQRRKDESFATFASRFRGLASKHLRYCDASPSSQVGQVLAITLLNNARLDEIVLTNAKMQLISLAQDRAKNDSKDDDPMIPLKSLEPAISFAEQFKETCDEGPESEDDEESDEKLDEFLDKTRNGSEELVEMLVAARDHARKEPSEEASLQEMFKDKSQVIKLHLDDAVTVLRNIAEGSQSKQQTFTHTEVQTMITQGIQSYFTKMGINRPLADAPPLGSGNYGGSSSDGKKRKGRDNSGGKGSSKGPKPGAFDSNGGRSIKRKRLNDWVPNAGEHCPDCGSKTHKRGDDACKRPAWATEKVREAKKREADKEKQGFHGGSSR